MSVVGTIVWLVTRNGILAISAAIAADFLAGIPTLMKSWTHPETETVYSYLGAVISMAILLLTITHWTFEEAAFPIFIVCVASVEVVPGGLRAGPAPAARPALRGPAGRADSPGAVGPPRRRRPPGRKVRSTPRREPSVPTAHANGIDIEYVTEGDPSDPPLLLVMGLGGQLIAWPEGFVDGLARSAASSLDHPLRQPRLRPVDQVRGAARHHGAVRGRPVSAPLSDRGHGGRRRRAARPSSASPGPTSSASPWAA